MYPQQASSQPPAGAPRPLPDAAAPDPAPVTPLRRCAEPIEAYLYGTRRDMRTHWLFCRCVYHPREVVDGLAPCGHRANVFNVLSEAGCRDATVEDVRRWKGLIRTRLQLSSAAALSHWLDREEAPGLAFEPAGLAGAAYLALALATSEEDAWEYARETAAWVLESQPCEPAGEEANA